jgi:hypothetical protein
MAVRDFNNGHTGDLLSGTIPSGLDATGAVTWAFVQKRLDATNWSCLVNAQNTTPGDTFTLEITSAAASTPNALRGEFTDAGGTTPVDYSTWTDLIADGWCIVVLSKAAGNAAPVVSIFKGGAWTHNTTVNAVPNSRSALGGTLRIGVYQGTTDWLTGRAAAAAVWVGTNLSTVQIATLSAGSISSWAAVGGGPTEHWEFNQAAWATNVQGQKGVLDLTASGSGAIVTGDDPASSIYTLASGATFAPRAFNAIPFIGGGL